MSWFQILAWTDCLNLFFRFSIIPFALIVDSHEISKGSATQFSVIEVCRVVTMSYGCSTFRHEPMLGVHLLWNVLCKIIFSMSASIHSEMKKSCSGGSICVEWWERSFSDVRLKAFLTALSNQKILLRNESLEEIFDLAPIIIFISE